MLKTERVAELDVIDRGLGWIFGTGVGQERGALLFTQYVGPTERAGNVWAVAGIHS
jgi:hypothetical protein